MKSAIVEKARVNKRKREEAHEKLLNQNARLRMALGSAESELENAREELAAYHRLKQEHERLVEWAVEAENKIDELKAALLELSE